MVSAIQSAIIESRQSVMKHVAGEKWNRKIREACQKVLSESRIVHNGVGYGLSVFRSGYCEACGHNGKLYLIQSGHCVCQACQRAIRR